MIRPFDQRFPETTPAQSELDPPSFYQGKRVALLGQLSTMREADATRLLEAHGATVVDALGDDIDVCVVGEIDFSTDAGRSGRLAGASTASGPTFVSEPEFLNHLDRAEGRQADEQRLYTTRQLAKILELSERTLRSWIRRGLLEPVKTVCRVNYFDFSQATQLKQLAKLRAGGVSPRKIIGGLNRLKEWLPEAVRPFSCVDLLEKEGELLIRLKDGRYADPSGQLRFDFSSPENAPLTTGLEAKLIQLDDYRPRAAATEPEESTPDAWYEFGAELEEIGDLRGALRAYQKALDLGGEDSEMALNLGNVATLLGDQRRAIQSYLRGVELDPEHVECWNNLGTAFADYRRWTDAIRSYEEAIRLAPEYPDAHYNLSRAYLAAGNSEKAWQHAFRYFKHDRHSSWARELHESLVAGQAG